MFLGAVRYGTDVSYVETFAPRYTKPPAETNADMNYYGNYHIKI